MEGNLIHTMINDLNVNLIYRASQKHPEECLIIPLGHPVAQPNWHKMNYHTYQKGPV